LQQVFGLIEALHEPANLDLERRYLLSHNVLGAKAAAVGRALRAAGHSTTRRPGLVGRVSA
jgi:hypothetical protein